MSTRSLGIAAAGALAILASLIAWAVWTSGSNTSASFYVAPAQTTTTTTTKANVKVGASTTTDTLISWIGNNNTILAKVTTSTGQPDVGVLVTARAKSNGQALSATTDTTGLATITGVTTGEWDVSSPTVSGNPQPTMLNLPGWVFGTCGGSVPPAPDPCDAVQATVKGMWAANVWNATLYKSWAKANPGENALFKAYLANPTGPVPQMKTYTGAMLVNVVTMYAQALGAGAIPFPPTG